MFYAIQEGDEYILRFRYDPQLIQLVKNVPGRQWHKDKKYWSIPRAHLGWLINEVKGTPYEHALQIQSEEHIDENASIDPTDPDAIPDIDISDVDLYVKEGSSLYNHQLAFLKYAKNKCKDGFILADDMGCITGDAIITVLDYNKIVKLSLEQVYDLYLRKYKYVYGIQPLSVLCYRDDDNSGFTFNDVQKVKYSGEKAVFKLQLSNGCSIKATADHEMLTDHGYVELDKLHAGENIITNKGYGEAIKLSDGTTKSVYHGYAQVVSITDVGVRPVYDIVMKNPYRNFVANDIVVHNCGKTLEVINYALYQRKRYGYKHCLIVACVNLAKYSWQEDIRKHTNGAEQGYILGTRLKRDGTPKLNTTGNDKVEDITTGHMYGDPSAPELPYFIITNIEALGRTKVGKIFTLEESLIHMINAEQLNLIALDECHKNMSPQSTQGKVILDMKKRTGRYAQWIPMTGTPIKNKPTDVFTPLKLVNGHEFKSFYLWSREFCIFGGYGDHQIVGYKNIPLLKELLQGHMIRRMKSEVLDLPPKIYYTEYVENTPYQWTLYNLIRDDLEEHREEILSSTNPLAAMLRLRQVNGSPEVARAHLFLPDNALLCPTEANEDYLKYNAKMKRLLELVDEILERDEKVVIFSNWAEPLRMIYRFVSQRCKTCCYVGSMSEEDREKHKRVFVNNPEYKAIVGTIGAMGVSVTLTVATNVIFYDDCWTPADKTQAEDRCNRIGSTEPLKVYTLLSKYTVDERVYEILEEKRGISDFIVDGKLNLKKNPRLFDFLLGNRIKDIKALEDTQFSVDSPETLESLTDL